MFPPQNRKNMMGLSFNLIYRAVYSDKGYCSKFILKDPSFGFYGTFTGQGIDFWPQLI